MARINKTKYAILGLLADQPMTGYDVKKWFDKALGYFWDAGYGQIYPTLKKMKNNGLVTLEVENEKNRPIRKIYTITQKGRDELREWLSQPADREKVKFEILLKLFFGHNVGEKTSIANVKDFRVRHIAMIETLNEYRKDLEKLARVDKRVAYMLTTVLLGIKISKACVEWSDDVVSILDNIRENPEKDGE